MTRRSLGARAGVLLAVLAGFGVFGPAEQAAAAGGGSVGQVSVPTLHAAWYQPEPACATPVGCLPTTPPPSTPYPAGTLHVGIAGGTETARTYLSLDLSKLPAGVSLTGGTLVIPLDTAQQDGSVSPATASVLACLAPAPTKDVEGSFASPPAVTCTTSSPALYQANKGKPRLVVDLSPFIGQWSDAAGLALVPTSAAVSGNETWHVVFSARTRTSPPTPPATATLSYAVSPALTLPSPTPTQPAAAPTQPPLAVTAPAQVLVPGLPAFSAPPAQTAPLAQASPVVAAPAQPALRSFTVGYAYPLVWLLPLLFLIGATVVGRSLTRDLRIAA